MNIKRTYTERLKTWRLIEHNWVIQTVNRSIIFLTVASFLCIFLRIGKLPPLVPLWFSRPWGADQLAHPYWLFLLPVGSVIIYAINRTLSVLFSSEYLIFAQVAFLTSLLISLLSFVTLVKILTLVG